MRNAFENIAAVIETGGGSLTGIVRIEVHVTTRAVRAELNPVWTEFFPMPAAARPAMWSCHRVFPQACTCSAS